MKCWIYHETESPKIIDASDYDDHHALGWEDTPAKFLKLEDVGIDKDKVDSGDEAEAAKAQQALDAVQGVSESINHALNIDSMTKADLTDYISEHFSIDLKQQKVKEMRKEAKKIAGVE